jgi:hypothetical protein
MLINEIKDNYTQIPNNIIIDNRLSDKALRVYLYIASKPTGWNVFNYDVMKSLNIKQKSTIANIWKQLDELGYISRVKVTQNSELSKTHKVGSYIYTIYSKSMSEPKDGISQSMAEPKDGVIQTHSNKELISNKEPKKRSNQKNTDCEIVGRFEKIWKAYKIPAKSKGVKSDALNIYKRKGIHNRSDKDIKIVLYAEMKKTYGQRHLTTIFNNFDGSLEMANEILNENSYHEQKEVLV